MTELFTKAILHTLAHFKKNLFFSFLNFLLMTPLLVFTSLAATWQRCSKEAENCCVRSLNLLSLSVHVDIPACMYA